jgi:hypothetical protein
MVAHRDPNDFLHIGRANDATSGSKQPMAPKEAGRVDAARRG